MPFEFAIEAMRQKSSFSTRKCLPLMATFNPAYSWMCRVSMTRLHQLWIVEQLVILCCIPIFIKPRYILWRCLLKWYNLLKKRAKKSISLQKRYKWTYPCARTLIEIWNLSLSLLLLSLLRFLTNGNELMALSLQF